MLEVLIFAAFGWFSNDVYHALSDADKHDKEEETENHFVGK